MKTKFDLGDEIYMPNDWCKEGYVYLGIVEGVKVCKYDYTLMRRDLKGHYEESKLIEFVYFRGSQSGVMQEEEASQVFKTKEEAISVTIAEKERKLAEAKEGLAKDEATIARLKELL